MKHTPRRLALLYEILRLRYGKTDPTLQDKAYFSYPVIAKYLNKSLHVVEKLARKYFRTNLLRRKQEFTASQIEHLTS